MPRALILVTSYPTPSPLLLPQHGAHAVRDSTRGEHRHGYMDVPVTKGLRTFLCLHPHTDHPMQSTVLPATFCYITPAHPVFHMVPWLPPLYDLTVSSLPWPTPPHALPQPVPGPWENMPTCVPSSTSLPPTFCACGCYLLLFSVLTGTFFHCHAPSCSPPLLLFSSFLYSRLLGSLLRVLLCCRYAAAYPVTYSRLYSGTCLASTALPLCYYIFTIYAITAETGLSSPCRMVPRRLVLALHLPHPAFPTTCLPAAPTCLPSSFLRAYPCYQFCSCWVGGDAPSPFGCLYALFCSDMVTSCGDVLPMPAGKAFAFSRAARLPPTAPGDAFPVLPHRSGSTVPTSRAVCCGMRWFVWTRRLPWSGTDMYTHATLLPRRAP